MEFRSATAQDIEAIVGMLANDPLGKAREQPGLEAETKYRDAFSAIDADENNQLLVSDDSGTVVAVLQLTFIPNMTYEGSWRAQIEGVRVALEQRGKGLGRALVNHAIQLAKARNCRIVQLTTDKQRPDAISFYEELGFEASHEGMKLRL